jgi:DNA-binding CsgD family transcriptional regulator
MPAPDCLFADALTQGQIDCLLLVGEHFTSKEIASRLCISPHTVDQRVRVALRVLGVKRRTDAARIVAEHYGSIFQWSSRSRDPSPIQVAAPHVTASRGNIALPFATRLRPRNEMSTALRLVWILVIGFAAAASAGIYLAGLESLSRLLADR